MVAQKSDSWAPQNHHSQWDRVVGVLTSRLPTSRQNPLHSFLEYDYIQILIPKQVIKDFLQVFSIDEHDEDTGLIESSSRSKDWFDKNKAWGNFLLWFFLVFVTGLWVLFLVLFLEPINTEQWFIIYFCISAGLGLLFCFSVMFDL